MSVNLADPVQFVLAQVKVEAKIDYFIKSITFSGGDTIELSQGDTLVVVGPNNAGKSSVLRELIRGSENKALGPVITACAVEKTGTVAEFQEWLDAKVLNLSLIHI